MGRFADNNRGVSLIEVLFSLVILSLVGMAALKTSVLSMNANVRDALHTEAVKIANDRMNVFFGCNLTQITADDDALLAATALTPDNTNFVCGMIPPIPAGTPQIQRVVANAPYIFTRQRQITDIGGGAIKQITIQVQWNYKGQPFTYTLTNVLKRAI